jgi:hypothetical protein
MARPLLAILGTLWLVAGVAGIVLGLFGAAWVYARLPPLAIDTDAVGGALTAIGVGLVMLAAVHAGLVIGLGAGRRWAMTAGILLAAAASIAFLAAAASAAASLARAPEQPGPLVAGLIAALAAAAGYGWCAVALMGRRRRIGQV